MILPYINYCNIVWAANYPTNLEKLIILQKRIVRIITGSGRIDHNSLLFKSLNILKVPDIIILQTSLFMYKLSKNLVPMQFSSYFVDLSSDIHDHYTRSYQKYHTQSIKTNVRKFSIKIRGPNSVYNNLPYYIKEVSSIRRCKMLLNTFLLGKD